MFINNFENAINNLNLSDEDKKNIVEIYQRDIQERNMFINIDEEDNSLLITTEPMFPDVYEIDSITKSELQNIVSKFIKEHNSGTKQFITTIADSFLFQEDFFEEPLRANQVYHYLYSFVSQDFTKLVYGSKKAFDNVEDSGGFTVMPEEMFYQAISNYVNETQELYFKAFKKFGKEHITDEMITYIIVEDLSHDYYIED